MKLFIDSSTDYLYIGLVDQNNNILAYINKGKKDHSETLIEHLQSFLKQVNSFTEKSTFCIEKSNSKQKRSR